MNSDQSQENIQSLYTSDQIIPFTEALSIPYFSQNMSICLGIIQYGSESDYYLYRGKDEDLYTVYVVDEKTNIEGIQSILNEELSFYPCILGFSDENNLTSLWLKFQKGGTLTFHLRNIDFGREKLLKLIVSAIISVEQCCLIGMVFRKVDETNICFNEHGQFCFMDTSFILHVRRHTYDEDLHNKNARKAFKMLRILFEQIFRFYIGSEEKRYFSELIESLGENDYDFYRTKEIDILESIDFDEAENKRLRVLEESDIKLYWEHLTTKYGIKII
ncbi:hypothetical protein MHBO_000999 [Bonamia ostreae]|uniref:Uncharacterized protein n=1 Tax=Bonamia ostreae TaxID=126728 RepID=A0ABV2AHJ3_9EUKA